MMLTQRLEQTRVIKQTSLESISGIPNYSKH